MQRLPRVPSVHDVPWSPAMSESVKSGPSVLLLLDHRRPSRAATARAARLALSLDASLRIVDVVPSQTPADRAPDLAITDTFGAAHCTAEVIYGDLREVALRLIRETDAELIVMGPEPDPELACELVDECQVPVLVAKPARPNGPFLAASDMRHLTYPVLSTGVELAERCGRAVTLFHNANPTPINDEGPGDPPCRYASVSDLVEAGIAAKAARLHGIAIAHERVDAVIAREPATEEAILELARERDADVVVVGRRARSWVGRVLGHHLTEHLLRRCQRSVLIVPVARAA